MASGIFAVLDDIAALMDDVSVAAKVATRKTAGILGDDLAVNAEKATGFLASREIPVLWAITKGSFVNKLIIIPLALLLNYFFPIVIKIILVIGGLYLAYEGMEKIYHFIFHRQKKGEEVIAKSEGSSEDVEKSKIKDALTTDFILSVEIVIIALGTVLEEPLSVQIISVTIVAILATIGVYGIVALIVRMDDAGYKMLRRSKNEGIIAALGKLLIRSLPVVIKALSIIGTIALLLVSGGIFSHNVDYFHHLFPEMNSTLKEFLLGVVMGTLVVLVITLIKKIFVKK